MAHVRPSPPSLLFDLDNVKDNVSNKMIEAIGGTDALAKKLNTDLEVLHI